MAVRVITRKVLQRRVIASARGNRNYLAKDGLVVEDWKLFLGEGYRLLAAQLSASGLVDHKHVADTPWRIIKALENEFFAGQHVDPGSMLATSFEEASYDQMIVVQNIHFISFCAHHFLPFLGRAYFAYIPDGKVVGLSKIPRLIDAFAARPQIQEQLTRQVVDTFQSVVAPRGCGLVMDALHTCMSVRGVKKTDATTRTTALTKIFLEASVKQEFLGGIPNGR